MKPSSGIVQSFVDAEAPALVGLLHAYLVPQKGSKLTAAVALAKPASAAGMSDMAEAVAKCTAANPGVMLNTQTKEYVTMILSPTAVASVPTTSSTPS